MCGMVESEVSREKNRTENDEKPSSVEILVFAFDFHPNAIHLGYSRNTEHTRWLH